jgi:hypothetical protein
VRPLAASCAIKLLTATLLWGGRLSCPQFFMVGQSKQSCCDSGGKCRRVPAKQEPNQECKKMPVGHPEQASRLDLPTPNITVAVSVPEPILSRWPVQLTHPVEHSPPDHLALHATLLI